MFNCLIFYAVGLCGMKKCYARHSAGG